MEPKPYKIFGEEEIDEATVDQFRAALDADFAVRGALLPDAHLGYSMPIGGVIGTDNTLVPAWVGYDIGCGVYGVQTTYHPEEVVEYADYIYENILRAVPVGFKHREDPVTWRSYAAYPKTDWCHKMFMDKKGFAQLGTLGGGNHFIEIGVDQESLVWIVIHSGSRNVGHTVATHYMKKANPEGKAKEGNWGFKVDTQEGRDYWADMTLCTKFALFNRMKIVEGVELALNSVVDSGEIIQSTMINRTHNHAKYNKELDMWIHRKGATHAENDMFGIIPGNMRDGSFVVRGLGCLDSLYSASHGAGRTMSRTQAKNELNIEEFVADMEGIYAEPTLSTLDESPRAYKSIASVMKHQTEMVEVIEWIKPLINVKG